MESSVWLVPRNWFKVTGSNSYSLSSDKLVIISLNSSPGIDILHGLVTQKLAVLVSLILNSNFTSSFGHFLFYNLKRWVILAFFKSLDRWLILFLLERKKRKVQRQNWSAASKFEVQRETQSAARAIRNHPKPNIRKLHPQQIFGLSVSDGFGCAVCSATAALAAPIRKSDFGLFLRMSQNAAAF